jgi:hypothetical protein
VGKPPLYPGKVWNGYLLLLWWAAEGIESHLGRPRPQWGSPPSIQGRHRVGTFYYGSVPNHWSALRVLVPTRAPVIPTYLNTTIENLVFRGSNDQFEAAIWYVLSRAIESGLSTLTCAIDELMEFHGEAEANSVVLPAIVAWYSEPSRLSKLLSLVYNEGLDTTLAKSFIHPSGFDKLVLLSGKHFALRVHNFHPKEVQRPSENIHNHRWEFASSIVYGYFISDIFVPNTKGTEVRNHYTYSKQGMSYQGRTGVSKVDSHTLTKGTNYYCPVSVYHSITEVASTGAITVMATGFAKGDTTEVYAKNELDTGEESSHCGLGMFDKDTLQAKFNSIKELVAA